MSTSSASYGRWAVATAETPIGHKTRVGGRAERGNARSPFHKLLGLLDDALMFVPRQYLVQAKSFDIGAAAESRSVLLDLLDFGLPRLELRLTCDRGAGISAWEATLRVAGITDRAKKIDAMGW